jgi:hypothetical protein
MLGRLTLKNPTDGFIVKVAHYRNYALVILTRNEHCPPHVHVGGDDWEARFKFSFWHDDVCLWDVEPAKNKPREALLENLRQTLLKPAHLRKAREVWWGTRTTVCLDNLMWQPETQEVVGPKDAKRGAHKIIEATFDESEYKTVLELDGDAEDVEIEHDDD